MVHTAADLALRDDCDLDDVGVTGMVVLVRGSVP
jgi:hypothetical protein